MKKRTVSCLLILALCLLLLAPSAFAAPSNDIGSAYLAVLRDNESLIPVKPWAALRGQDGLQDKTDDLKSVAVVDLNGDGVSELVFLTAADIEWTSEKRVSLHAYTFYSGSVRHLCSVEIGRGGGTTPHYFKVWQNSGSSTLYVQAGASHATDSTTSYYVLAMVDGEIIPQTLRKTETSNPGSNITAVTCQYNELTITPEEYARLEAGMYSPPVVVMFDSGSESSGQNGMYYDEAVRYLTSLIPAPVTVGVKVHGVSVQWTDAAPFIDQHNRTMVPLRAVAEALGLTVSWDGTKREAVFTNGAKTIYFPIGSPAARTGDGDTLSMDTAAVIVNDRTYAPIRYLAEYFDFSVGWDGASRTVLIG